jgi:hypothetical protein
LMNRYEAPHNAASDRNMTQERRDIRLEDGRRGPSVQMKTSWGRDKLC